MFPRLAQIDPLYGVPRGRRAPIASSSPFRMSRQPLSQADLNDVRRIAARCLGPAADIQHLPSHQNVVCRVRLADGRRRIVKMAKRDGSSSRGSIIREPSVYALLADAGLPAPRVHCGEGHDGSLGRAWFACDDLGRRTAADTGGLANVNRRSLYAELGQYLARVHDVRVTGGFEGLGLAGGVAASPLAQWHGRQIARALHDRMFRGLAAERLEVLPLEPKRRPAHDAGASLCHGDFHPAQAIRRGPHLVATVDWESAHAGDPGYDHAAFEVMLRVTCPGDLAEAALSAYAKARPFHDATVYDDVRTAHAVALAVTFTDARRPAFARSAKMYAQRRLAGEAAAA